MFLKKKRAIRTIAWGKEQAEPTDLSRKLLATSQHLSICLEVCLFAQICLSPNFASYITKCISYYD